MNAHYVFNSWYQTGGAAAIGLLGVIFAYYYTFIGGGRR